MPNIAGKFTAWCQDHRTMSTGKSWAGYCGAMIFNFAKDSGGWKIAPKVTGPTAANVRQSSTIKASDPASAPIGAFHWWDDGGPGHVGVDLLGGGKALGMGTSVGKGKNLGSGLQVMSVGEYIAARPSFAYKGWSLDYGRGIPAWDTTPDPEPPVGLSVVYTVKPGDNLSTIADKLGSTVAAIMAANPQIKNEDLIYPPQQITVPQASQAVPGPLMYTVRNGDNLTKIAKRFGTTVAQIVAWNNIPNPNLIRPGEEYRVR